MDFKNVSCRAAKAIASVFRPPSATSSLNVRSNQKNTPMVPKILKVSIEFSVDRQSHVLTVPLKWPRLNLGLAPRSSLVTREMKWICNPCIMNW